jgi:inhibitor of Bruton tyrosine kinase
MTQLHAYFLLRQQQSFQRLLDGSRGQSSSGLSSSGGKSWNRPSTLMSAMVCDVNARDWLGRTVLHLACASIEPSSLEYLRLLLAHPAVNVNLQDTESHWTALHRALFHGNIAAA